MNSVRAESNLITEHDEILDEMIDLSESNLFKTNIGIANGDNCLVWKN